MNKKQFNQKVNEAMELSYNNPIILNMLTLLTYYSQSDFVTIFRVMAGPLASRIIDEIIDERKVTGAVIPINYLSCPDL